MNGTEKKKGAIAWMAGNSVAANLIMLMCLIGGIISAFTIKKEVFPEFTTDTVTISVNYPGASPEEIEKGVVLPVEEQISGINGIDKISSTSMEGSGMIQVDLLVNQDNYRIYQEIQTEVNKITTFPEGTEKPQVTLSFPKRGVITLVIYGDYDKKTVFNSAEELRDALLSDSHITQVELTGSDSPEISVEISKETLRRYGVSIQDIADKIKATSVEVPGGEIKTDKGNILLRVSQRGETGLDFGKMTVLRDKSGSNITLDQIAAVKDDFEETDRKSLYNGVNAITIDVYRVGDQTPVDVADATKRVIQEFKPGMPPEMSVEILNDQSEIYTQRVDLLLGNAYLGMALVLIFLGLFLELRLALWVTLGIPVSFMGAFLFLPSLGVSINVTSLFAFIIALGIVVDDAIVIGEMIYEKRQSGLSPFKASVEGTKAVVLPVTFSVLTNIVTFVPLLFVPGMMGKIFGEIPVVVITVFSVSLIEAVFVLPSHLNKKEPKRGKIESFIYREQQKFSNGFMGLIDRFYKPFLEKSIEHRYITMCIAIAILVTTGAYVGSGRIGFVIMPKIESAFSGVEVELPYEAPFSDAEDMAGQIVKAAYAVDEKYTKEKVIQGIYTNIGPSSDSTGAISIDVRIYLTDAEKRKLSTAAFTEMWRAETGELRKAEKVMFASDMGGPGHGYSIELEIAHNDSGMVEKISSELADMAREIPIVTDIDDGFSEGKVQYTFKVLPAGESLGLTASEIGKQVRNSFKGAEALRQVRGRHEIKVMARLPKNERVNEYDVENLILRASDGTEIPLSEAAEVKYGRSYTKLEHVNGKRVAIFSANVEPEEKTQMVTQMLESKMLPLLKERYPGLSWSFGGRQKEIGDSLSSLFRYMILALIVIFALLAIPLRSYSQPFMIMISIPFGIIGAVGGHIAMGQSLSIISIMGIVALSGVVINDSLVLIEYANTLVSQGYSHAEAVVTSGVRRFRPILLTTITTFGGLAPMVFDKSREAQFMIPMAVSLAYGLLFSTVITLVIIPSLYVIINGLRKFR